jgi:hypothetical protein
VEINTDTGDSFRSGRATERMGTSRLPKIVTFAPR